MRTAIMTVLILGAFAGAAYADEQAATMKRLLASGKSVPTGIDVPGPTFYENNVPAGMGQHFQHQTSAGNAKRFWDIGSRFGGGSSTAGAGN